MKEFNAMLNILFTLREKCPSDKARTSQNIIECLKEELSEVEEEIKSQDKTKIEEELGDLFWNILFLIKCESEKHNIKFENVMQRLNNKMLFRHPHVFKEPRQVTKEEADKIWQEQKALEKKLKLIH